MSLHWNDNVHENTFILLVLAKTISHRKSNIPVILVGLLPTFAFAESEKPNQSS
jgi:hypothetical protein